jgi:omega-6 fatty acid desaturase / acyl-lipid omega-6 desaturase (Delta-12 desaturase)
MLSFSHFVPEKNIFSPFRPSAILLTMAVSSQTTMKKQSAEKMAAEKGQHLDLNGNVFELPTFTMKEIHDVIPAHCFKPSILRSMAYVVRDYFYLSTLIFLAITYIPLLPNVYLRFAAWVAYTTVQGFVFTGIWILAHECGHGAFSKSKKLNYTMGLIMHSFLLVPFHSWRLSHSQHHKATGNIEKDTAFVPHSRESWIQLNFGATAKANMVEFTELAEDSPIATLWNCIIHQVFGWPGYLLFNLTGQEYGGAKGMKISHFYFGEDSVFYKKAELPLILLSDIGVATMIAALVVAGQVFGSWNVIVLWGVPWLWVNNWIGESFLPR